MLRDSGFGTLHDKEGYKFFCFSNIFPIGDMGEGEILKLLVASPNDRLIESLKAPLQGRFQSDSLILEGDEEKINEELQNALAQPAFQALLPRRGHRT